MSDHAIGSRRTPQASEDAAGDQAEADETFSITMADRGRLVLPVAVRERLHIHAGDALTLSVEPGGTMTLQTSAAAIAKLRGAFKHLAPGRKAVDELIAGRRRDAVLEERDTRALARRSRRKPER